MGACTFFTRSSGPSAREAFRSAIDQARYEYGHGGYTGTIAEKSSFVTFDCPEGVDPYNYADSLLESNNRINDKYGPAGAVKIVDNEWLFFGWASE